MQNTETMGELTLGEMRMLTSLTEQAANITREIGVLELRKVSLIQTYTDLDVRVKAMLEGAARRLGIPDGEQWSVGADGKFHRLVT